MSRLMRGEIQPDSIRIGNQVIINKLANGSVHRPAFKDPLVLQVPLVRLVRLVLKVPLVHKDLLVRVVRLETPARRDKMA